MGRYDIFEEENKGIYSGLVFYRAFNNLDKILLDKIINLILNEREDERRILFDIREYIKNIFKSNILLANKYKHLSSGGLISFLFHIYVSLAIIKVNTKNSISYFEMLDNARKIGIKSRCIKRKGANWIAETGFLIKYRHVNAGILLLLLDLLKQLRKEGEIRNKRIFDSINQQYLLAQKINKLFKPLTKEQYEDITKHFYVFKMDPKDGRCYYELGPEKVYVDDLEDEQ